MKEISRRQLTEELVTLGFNPTSLSPQITQLLDRGALAYRVPDRVLPHKIGDAY